MSGRRHAVSKATPKRTASSRPTGRPTAPRRRRLTGTSTTSPSRRARPSAPSRKPASSRTSARTSATRSTRTATGSKAPRPAGSTAAARVAAETRRNRIPVVLGAAAAAVILVTSFPLSVLLSQHRQLSAEAAQLSTLQHQNSLLAEQSQQLNTNAEVKRLARQNYQLVLPGQALYDILPPAGTTTPTAQGAPTAGDPADQPLVSPSQAPDMSPDPGLPSTTVPASTGTSGTPRPAVAEPSGGFWSRVGSTLEFWK